MGLDMYLTKRLPVQELNLMSRDERKKLKIDRYGSVEVMYWIKVNAIHDWFVRYVQGGIDDCNEYCVSIDELKALLSTIKKVLSDRYKAPDILPTRSGLFFGGTEYDEWYFTDLENTARVLKKELAIKNNKADYFYQSSW